MAKIKNPLIVMQGGSEEKEEITLSASASLVALATATTVEIESDGLVILSASADTI